MTGTRSGGIKAAAKNTAGNPDYYITLGKRGGSTKKTKPFGFQAMTKEQVAAAGKKGGAISRRKKPVDMLTEVEP